MRLRSKNTGWIAVYSVSCADGRVLKSLVRQGRVSQLNDAFAHR